MFRLPVSGSLNEENARQHVLPNPAISLLPIGFTAKQLTDIQQLREIPVQ